MNKIYSYLFLLFTLFSLTACSLGTPRTGNLVFETYHSEEDIFLTNDKAAPHAEYKFNLEFPIKGDEDVLEWVQKEIITFAFSTDYHTLDPQKALDLEKENYKKDYLSTIKPLYLEELEKVQDSRQVGMWYNFHQHITNTVTYYQKSLLTLQNYFVGYTGGAHGIYHTLFLNLDLQNKKVVKLDDLFLTNAEPILKQCIIKQLQEKYQTNDLQEEGFWVKNITSTENFYLSDKGITFFYNVYEITPYAMGVQEVTIPFSRLKDILNTNHLILKELLNL